MIRGIIPVPHAWHEVECRVPQFQHKEACSELHFSAQHWHCDVSCKVTLNLVRMVSFALYRYAPHNDVSINDGPHIRRWSYKVIILYDDTYRCITIAYYIQYSNMLYSFVV